MSNLEKLFADWNRDLASILAMEDRDQALISLVTALESLVKVSASTVIVYPSGQRPFVPCHTLRPHEDPAIQIEPYLNGSYLVDPYYRLAIEENASGVFTLNDVAPHGFKESEFYQLYYNRTGYTDEACFLVQVPDQCLVILSLGRAQGEPIFTDADKYILQAAFPMVEHLLRQWRQQEEAVTPSQMLHQHMEQALQHFGSSLLTKRECDVLHLMLRGHSSKSAAQKLDVSLDTIKHHRKNIYTKLDIASQIELFHLFMDSLASASAQGPLDPLEAYLSPAS